MKGTAMTIVPLLALGVSQVSSVDSRRCRFQSTLYWFVACTGFTQHARAGQVFLNGSRTNDQPARATKDIGLIQVMVCLVDIYTISI